jgi:hypothetical protein
MKPNLGTQAAARQPDILNCPLRTANESDRLGKHAQRVGLGDVRDRIDPGSSDEFVREFLGRFLETCAQARHRPCRRRPIHHRTTTRMQWRIGLED